jgi:hypothetical protein
LSGGGGGWFQLLSQRLHEGEIHVSMTEMVLLVGILEDFVLAAARVSA